MRALVRLVALVTMLTACGSSPPQPVAIDTANDTCAHCRMILVDRRLAAEIVAAGEEPMVFDDIGCLRDYLADHTPVPGARIFVADHRTASWIPAAEAVYTRSAVLATPMASGILAHADVASRDADTEARGETLDVAAILGSAAAAQRARP
jgi:copper chaperone NosL